MSPSCANWESAHARCNPSAAASRTPTRSCRPLLELRLRPGAVQHRRVAERYRTLKILDAAFDHYSALDNSIARMRRRMTVLHASGAIGDSRIWDWRTPPALFTTHRPGRRRTTPSTILAAMDRVAEARSSYQQALSLAAARRTAQQSLLSLVSHGTTDRGYRALPFGAQDRPFARCGA